MVGLFARGRIVWWIAIVLGLVLLIWGIAVASQVLWIVGIILIVAGVFFLVISYVTKGQSD